MITEGFAFRGRVTVINESTPNDILFTDCRLDSGMTTSGRDTGMLRLARCVVSGDALLAGRIVIADSNEVAGAITLDSYDGLAELRGNSVAGVGETGIMAGGYLCRATGNRVVGFTRGMFVYGDDLVLRDNTVQGCAGIAIEGFAFSSITAEDNSVTESQGGIVLDGDFVTTRRNKVVGTATAGIDQLGGFSCVAEGNIVMSCAGNGIELREGLGFTTRVDGNVVGRCGGTGIFIRTGSSFDVRGNTCYLNGGHGITFYEAGDIGVVARNLSYRNQGAGMQLYLPVEIACNDWFENAGGAILGQPPGATDVALDPIFCNLTSDDVSLRVDSPLLAMAGCGQIGALGQGCDVTTPTLVIRFTARTVTAGVELRWQVSHVGGDLTVRLERAHLVEGPWDQVESERSVDGDVTVELDRDVSPGRTYWYRLVASEAGGVRVLGPPLEVTTAPQARFGLLRVAPSPTRGPIQVEFGLAETARVELDVFDVQGRHVASLARGSWPAGRHQVEWSEQTAPGLFLVRYRHAGGSESRRVLRIE